MDKIRCSTPYLPLISMTFVINLSPTKVLHEFGIKHNRYAFCCVMLAGKIVISLPIQFCSEDMVSCPKLAN